MKQLLLLLVACAQVFFVGRSGAPKIQGNPNHGKANFGYDDDRGDYNVVPHDHLGYRYEVLSVLGKGSFGQVRRERGRLGGAGGNGEVGRVRDEQVTRVWGWA